METENKAPEAEKDKKSESCAENAQAETAAETSSEATPEAAEETIPEAAEDAAPAKSEQPESTPEAEVEAAPDNTAELEQLRSENARLKAQLEAHGAGFRGEYIEDAVLIAENAARRDGITITEALQAVAKKYPEWKHTADDKGRSGFKVGAEAPKEDKTAEDDRLDEAFGIRKKK